MDWTPEDVEDLAARGHDTAWAERVIGVLVKGTHRVAVHRPATPGDGVRVLPPTTFAALEALHESAARAGRITSFVPASGAATRLCRDLLLAYQGGAATMDDLGPRSRALLEALPQMALWHALPDAKPGDVRSILSAMFGPDGVALHQRPKALVPFHLDARGPRTALDEQIDEARALGADASGKSALHLTVGKAHRASFEAALAQVGDDITVTLSVQAPPTDMLALDASGAPFRRADGRLLFRPGGHGALLANLDALDGDIVLVKNIDNVVASSMRADNLAWRARLVGVLVRLQARAHAYLNGLADGETRGQAQAFVAEILGRTVEATPEALRDALDRPWRVCGMVRASGQPGGGPFFADSPDGTTLQIVEGPQLDPAQAEVLAEATHFNPVDMALGVRDAHGMPYDLHQFTDPSAVIVTDKTYEGRALRAIEHPGLWNGQMARWNTVFVEVPPSTFEPVKVLEDLLAPAHSGQG